MASKLDDFFGLQVKRDVEVSPKAPVQFSTDCVLLRKIDNDLLPKPYSATIIENHMRELPAWICYSRCFLGV